MLTDNVFLGAMTAGALVVTVLVACYTLLWHGIKDWETGVILTIMSVGILGLMDPLVLNWLPLLVPKDAPTTQALCDQLAAWRRGLELGTYSIPFFAAFCTVRVADLDWAVAQWVRRVLLLQVKETEAQTTMAAFSRSKGWRGTIRIGFILLTMRLAYLIYSHVNPVVCKPPTP